MIDLAERAYFTLCLGLGRLLRASRYAEARIVSQGGELRVRKHRRFYAPLLIWLGDPLVRLLDTGVKVLPQREWEEREWLLYRSLHGIAIRIETGRTLVLPGLAGETLASLLENPHLGEPGRKRAFELAVVALAEFHRLGFTHGDAMAENVLVDFESDVAHWFDFETLHDPRRPLAWRRADDLRALLTTCLVRAAPEQIAETIELVLGAYADDGVTRALAANIATVFQRSLTFHLGQAPLSYRRYREISRFIGERGGGSAVVPE